MTDTFQWQRCDPDGTGCADIPGETAATYLLAAADLGKRIRARGQRNSGTLLTSGLTSIITDTPAASSVYWGARIDGGFYVDHYGASNGDDAPWAANNPAPNNWDRFESHAGKKITCVHWGATISALPSSFDSFADSLARSRGAFSMYGLSASRAEIVDLAANSDAHGVISKLRTWALAVAATGRPMLVRPMHEMNGNWGYAWQTAQGTNAAAYVAAFQRMVTVIRAAAPNISIFWCPNIWSAGGVPDPTPWFPGTGYVDWVGFDGYNQNTGSYSSPASLFDDTMATVTGLAPGKPVGIGETGCAAPTGSPGKAAWITDLLSTWLPANPDVKLLMWFNEYGNPTLPHIEVGDAAATFGGAAQAAFQAGIADSRYAANIVTSGTFPSGGLVPVPA